MDYYESLPIWRKDDCGAVAVTDLINNRGTDFLQRDPFVNETVLHYWAGTPFKEDSSHRQEDSLAVVKLLVEKGSDLLAINSRGFTPLLEAATGRTGVRSNLEVLDFLLERDEYSRTEKVEALELAGAVILGNLKNASNFQKALDYWRKALQLRQMDVEGSGLIPKTILNLKSVRTTEWITSAELEDVIDHPDKYVIQSFLVRYRIFLYKSWKAMIPLFQFYTWDSNNIIWQLRNEGRFVDIFDILWGLLETFCRFYSGENSALDWMTNEVIKRLIWAISRLEKDSPDFWTEEIIKTSLDLIESATRSHRIDLYPLIQLVEILFRLPPTLKKGALETISEIRDHFGRNLLHVAFSPVK